MKHLFKLEMSYLKTAFLILLLFLCCPVMRGVTAESNSIIGPIVGFQFNEMTQTIFILIGLVLISAFFKVIFSNIPPKFEYHRYIPESAVVIMLGIVLGGMILLVQNVYGVGKDNPLLSFNGDLFFLFLIPPLILESGYFLQKDFFTKHLTLILLYAVLGTLLNTVAIGASLWAFDFASIYQYHFSLLDCLLFASLIGNVDPVAVLSIFDDVGVNETLYMLVFGESVLNDAVSIVMYNLIISLRKLPDLHFGVLHALLSIVKLVYVSIGGIAVGVVFGFFGALSTRFTSRTPLLEPLFVLAFAFLSYFVAESILMSGIMSILFCGAFMNRYVELNIQKKSHVTLKYGLKMIASTAETLVFMYLGISIVLHHHLFDWAFTLATLVFIIAYRFLFVYGITIVYNMIRKRQKKGTISMQEAFVLGYSGLRGIVFALAFIIPNDSGFENRKRILVTTTMVVSCFTIFIQGSTIRPIMNHLSIKSDKKTRKQVSQELAAERMSFHFEEREITNVLKHVIFLESTTRSYPEENGEYIEFKEVNIMIEEQALEGVLKGLEDLMSQIIVSKENYLNSECLYDDLTDMLDVVDRVGTDWGEYLERIGLSKIPEASDEISSTVCDLTTCIFASQGLLTESDSVSTFDDSTENQDDDVESQRSNVRLSSTSSDGARQEKPTTLLRILKDAGIVYYTSENETINNLELVEWARNEKFLFYMERVLMEKNIAYLIDKTNDSLNSSDFSQVETLLRVLRTEVKKQQESRMKVINHLKKIDFAYNVFSMGAQHTFDIIEAMSGVGQMPSYSRPKFWIKKIDALIQKLVVRNLHAEEYNLVKTLESMKKFENQLTWEPSATEAEDEQSIMKSLQEGENLYRALDKASLGTTVNLQRVMREGETKETTEGTSGKQLRDLLALGTGTISDKEYKNRMRIPDFKLNDEWKDAATRSVSKDFEFRQDKLDRDLKKRKDKLGKELLDLEMDLPSSDTTSFDTSMLGGGRPSGVVMSQRRRSYVPPTQSRQPDYASMLRRRNTMVMSGQQSLEPDRLSTMVAQRRRSAVAQRRASTVAPPTPKSGIFVPARRQSVCLQRQVPSTGAPLDRSTLNVPSTTLNIDNVSSLITQLNDYNPFGHYSPNVSPISRPLSPSGDEMLYPDETSSPSASPSSSPSPNLLDIPSMSPRRKRRVSLETPPAPSPALSPLEEDEMNPSERPLLPFSHFPEHDDIKLDDEHVDLRADRHADVANQAQPSITPAIVVTTEDDTNSDEVSLLAYYTRK